MQIALQLGIKKSYFKIEMIPKYAKIFVKCVNTATSTALFYHINEVCKKRNTTLFALNTGAKMKTSKFRKWSVSIDWFSEEKCQDAYVKLDDEGNMLQLMNKFKKKGTNNFKIEHIRTRKDEKGFIKLVDVMGNKFEDEIELQDFIEN